jgi:hypothetical protein
MQGLGHLRPQNIHSRRVATKIFIRLGFKAMTPRSMRTPTKRYSKGSYVSAITCQQYLLSVCRFHVFRLDRFPWRCGCGRKSTWWERFASDWARYSDECLLGGTPPCPTIPRNALTHHVRAPSQKASIVPNPARMQRQRLLLRLGVIALMLVAAANCRTFPLLRGGGPAGFPASLR